MASCKSEKERQAFRAKVLFAAAKLFLEKGYSQTSTREIAKTADVNVSTMNKFFGLKENILAELVEHVLEGQFSRAKQFLADKTDDPILFYAAETTLQLYIVECGENIRDLYAAAYSMPATTKTIREMVTGKLEYLFKDHLPDLKTRDFYLLEIASGSIMWGFMTIPCDMWFTMGLKVKAFLESTLRVYRVPETKIQEAIEFVSQFDFETIAKQTIASMLESLEDRSA